jgi:hypothetical protein
MFYIDTDKIIHITRGDVGVIEVNANKSETEPYIFKPGDLVRFKVVVRKQHETVVIEKDTIINEESTIVEINLYQEDTKIGDIINKPVDYWYEIELNPDTCPQTIIGYDADGPKIFRVYPEGGERT